MTVLEGARKRMERKRREWSCVMVWDEDGMSGVGGDGVCVCGMKMMWDEENKCE